MGSGFRTFTAGEVLTASNVQNYLQDQVVMTFAGSAARSSAIGTANFEEGMVSYLTDTDKVEAYNGTNWVQVGSSNQGLTLINTTSFSAVASFSLPASTFSATYDNYVIKLDFTSSTSNGMYLRLRASGTDATGANYFRQMVTGDGGTASGNRESSATYYNFGYSNTGRSSATMEINSPFIARPTTGNTIFNEETNSSGIATRSSSWGHNVSTAYDSATIYPNTGTVTGTYSVYGYND
jgi:hypothetical protein